MKKNLITVLKKLLKAFGGDDESVKNNAVDIIDKIADNASGGGSSSAPYIVNMISVGHGRYDADKTWQEIHDAYMSGIPVFIHLPDTTYEEYTYNKDSYFTVFGVQEQPTDHMYDIYFYRPGDNIRALGSYDDPNGYPSFSTE